MNEIMTKVVTGYVLIVVVLKDLIFLSFTSDSYTIRLTVIKSLVLTMISVIDFSVKRLNSEFYKNNLDMISILRYLLLLVSFSEFELMLAMHSDKVSQLMLFSQTQAWLFLMLNSILRKYVYKNVLSLLFSIYFGTRFSIYYGD